MIKIKSIKYQNLIDHILNLIQNIKVKSLYKLMNNVVYGKTVEKLRNRIDVGLASKNKTI